MFSIAHHRFESPFILAPLAGYTDLPFRLLCRRYGASFCVSEMISCHGLVYNQSNTLRMLESVPQEKPVSFQLFGAEPEAMGEAAAILSDRKPEMIDINMGCPVRKVTRKGGGAALMTTPQIARRIILEVVKNASVPVTVKMRSGKDQATINCVEFARMAEECGASAVTIHARTWSQGFSGTINPDHILMVKSALSIPVIGNGDIGSRREGLEMMKRTGCDAVMIGRGALGNPWIFSDQGRPATLAAISAGAREHLSLIEAYLPAERILGYVKNQICRYFRSLPDCSALRKNIFGAGDLPALKKLLEIPPDPGQQ
ncbi:tRNA dihydrouridine synthase DusB [Desulforhopalus singaporensis]|uniref:tRNA-dihydrouridine synthase n=1 Tax=Desulforhopalus singaporensis TaxID=91360 RepID=A0A1H0PEX1_9BACT|nr:tRNA dihydrouridine synthase DusB [Desulforhopalus singaporensis]SDP03642.1 tRNA-U20-dihydrouridine synthase [Desulforhopalus singaporensis]